MSEVTGVLNLEESRQAATGRRFVWWLLLAGVVPFPVFALLCRPSAAGPDAQLALTTLLLISVAHGGLSGLFWFDRRYRSYMAGLPRQYYGNIALLGAVSLVGVFVLGQGFFDVFSMVYVVWNLFHFGRQNWGILCLAALGTSAAKPARLENFAGLIACAGAAMATLSWQWSEPPHFVYQLGFVAVLTGLALSLVVACRQVTARADPLRIAMTVSIGGFFLPIFLLGPIGVTAIGTAHAAQYAIVMTVLAGDRKHGPVWFRIAGMSATMVLYLALYVLLNDPGIAQAWLLPAKVASGLIVMWHYIIDAGLWRLRQPFQRNAVKQSFPFLFAAPRPGEPA